VAYQQFCQHFLAPLALMTTCDVRLGQLLRVHIDGIPLDPKKVWDLGGNTGVFNNQAAGLGAYTVAFDIDPATV